MQKAVSYKIWPRRRDGTLLFNSTSDAFFYAAQVHNLPDQVSDLRKQYETINRELWNQMRSKKRNNLFLLLASFKNQFHRECIEEVERLQIENGV